MKSVGEMAKNEKDPRVGVFICMDNKKVYSILIL